MTACNWKYKCTTDPDVEEYPFMMLDAIQAEIYFISLPLTVTGLYGR